MGTTQTPSIRETGRAPARAWGPNRLSLSCVSLMAGGLVLTIPGFVFSLVISWFALAASAAVGLDIVSDEHAECLWWQAAGALTWLVFAAVVGVVFRRVEASAVVRWLGAVAVVGVTVGVAELVGHPAAGFFPLDCGL